MPHYLVTGGAGFIGASIARRLLSRGDRVTIVDNLSTGSRDNVPDGAAFVLADLALPDALASMPSPSFDAILHLGAQSSGEVSHVDPIADFDTNARGTLLLLRWAERHAIRRFLFASSMAIYGETPAPAREDQLPAPASFYGVSKATAEAAVSMFGRRGGETTIFRMFNVYGPGQNLANLRQGMVSIYLAYLLKGEPIQVKGSLDRYRDLVFIDDVVHAWIAALDDGQSIGGTYNVGTGSKVTVQALVDALVRAFGHQTGSYPVTEMPPTAGDLRGAVADVTRIAADLGWRARIGLEEGIARMVEWAQQQSASAHDR